MASNGFAKVLKRNSWRLTTILVYAVLEWMLILLLLISALFQYITTKFASFFGLQPPCLWCSRLDHILEPKEPDFYRKLICDRHAKEISLLGYCRNHRKLADAHGMCEDCAFSMPTHCSAENNESKPSWITCMSLVADMGFDLPKKTVAKGLLTNGHVDEFKPRGAEPDEKPMNGWVSEELCTCCNAPLVHKLYSHNIIKTILFDGKDDTILKPQWNTLDYAGNCLERALEGENGLKKQSVCVCGGTQVKISEVFVSSPNESNVVSSSSVTILSDDETESREEKVDSNSIDLEENAKDVSETHCSEAPDEVQIEPRSLEVFQDDVDSAVTIQPDIFVDKRIAYPEITTQECGMVPDVTITEMVIEDTANDQVIKRLAFVEEPLESTSEEATEDVEGLIQASADVGNQNEESIEDVANQIEASIEDAEDQNEVAAADSTCNSLQLEEIASEVVTKGLDDGDDSDPHTTCSYAGSVDLLPKSFEASPDAEDIPAEVELVEERDCVAVTEQGDNATEITNEDYTELPLEDTIAVSEPFPVNIDDHTASLNSEGVADETQDLEDSEMDGIKGSEADPRSPEIVTEPTEIGNEETTSTDVVTEESTSTDVAAEEETSTYVATQEAIPNLVATEEATPNLLVTEEATMEISDALDVDSRREEIDAVSEYIDVTTREDQRCNGPALGDLDGNSIQNLDQNSTEAGHQEHNEADKMDEDRASETPRSIEGIQFLHKRMQIDRKESSPDSLDGSIISEIDGEFEADRLKRALEAERKALNTLYSELEEERNAAAIAANQTMAMITRLQEEKAAVQMEALQYQRMMEEQSEYDQEALQLLNEILVKREKEKQELEKELDLCRRRLLQYEAKERRMEKKMRTYENERPSSAEKGEETPENQSCRNRTSSSSSLSDNSDDVSSDPNDVNDQLEAGEINQNTPSDLIMSVGRGYVDTEQRTSLDESLVDFEEERISILEQLKVLEEKLHTFANDDQAGMAHPEANGIEDNMKESDEDKETVETMNGNGTPTARRVGGGKGKRLLPLFDATNVEEDSLHHAEELSLADRSNDWHNVSMVVTDNNRLVIEEEVYNLYERLQALEADREFLKHTIKSLRKGDEVLLSRKVNVLMVLQPEY
ncbi:hypothetical protein SUGI_1036840 [Cryptomeria japonica]|nr:hypothetical protein SUGI_1036840 [Cryptomeria japonica]